MTSDTDSTEFARKDAAIEGLMRRVSDKAALIGVQSADPAFSLKVLAAYLEQHNLGRDISTIPLVSMVATTGNAPEGVLCGTAFNIVSDAERARTNAAYTALDSNEFDDSFLEKVAQAVDLNPSGQGLVFLAPGNK